MHLVISLLMALMPFKNYTNYSVVMDMDVSDSSVYLATNGGVISFSDVGFNDTALYFIGFEIYGSARGLPHNTILSVASAFDTLWVVPKNAGLFYKMPDESNFNGYFIPYSGIKGARKVRKYKDVLFLQLANAILRIKLNNNLDPNDDDLYIISHDTTGVMDVFGDSLYYSVQDTLFILHVFSQYPTDTVLCPSVITALSKGEYLCIGTENGVYVKDAQNLVHYDTGEVYKLFEKNDTIYAACSSGAFIIHSNTLNKIDDRSYALFEFKGHLFTDRVTNPKNTYYNGGLFVLKDGTFLPLPKGIPTNLITTMATDGKYLYVGTLDWANKPKYLPSKAFYITDDDGCHFVDSIGNSDGDAIRIVRYGNGKVFFGAYASDSRGLFVLENGKVRHLTDFPSLLFNDLWIREDSFIALWGDGIYRWHDGKKDLIYSVNYPSFFAVDSLKRLWIGTEASGIIVTDTQGNIIRAINYELPSPAITAIERVGDKMAVGTDRGLVLFDKNFVPFNIISGLRIRSLAMDKYQRLYALSDSALYFINTNDHSYRVLLSSPPLVPIGAPDWEVRNVLVIDDKLNMYIGSREGILVVKLDEPTPSKGSIRIFPNPVEEGSSITICASSSFKILSINRKNIGSFTKGCHIIKADGLSPGLYVVLTSSKEKGKFVIKEKK